MGFGLLYHTDWDQWDRQCVFSETLHAFVFAIIHSFAKMATIPFLFLPLLVRSTLAPYFITQDNNSCNHQSCTVPRHLQPRQALSAARTSNPNSYQDVSSSSRSETQSITTSCDQKSIRTARDTAGDPSPAPATYDGQLLFARTRST